MRSALQLLLQQQPGLTLMGAAADCEALLPQLLASCPDLILIDWDLSLPASATCLQAIQGCCPRARIIALCGQRHALQAGEHWGVDAVVSTAEPPDRLLRLLEMLRAEVEER